MKKDISDKELGELLTKRIKEDPRSFLQFLKNIIDQATPSVAINNNSVFELLKPEFGHRKQIPYNELPNPDIIEEDFDLIPTSTSVDQLFYPWIRAKLKEWQDCWFDRRLEGHERDKGKNNIEKAFGSLIWEGSGRPKAIPSDIARKINYDYVNVQLKCNEISKTRRWGNTNSRADLIRSAFPDVSAEITNEDVNGITTPDEARNLVLSKRYDCSPRNVKDFLRGEHNIFREFYKYRDTSEKTSVATIEDDPKKRTITFKDGRQIIKHKTRIDK